MEDNHFTILCWFLPYIKMNQPQVYIYHLPLEPPPHPITPFYILLPKVIGLVYRRKKKKNQSFCLGKSAMKHICPYLTEVERPSRKIKVAHLIYESHFILIITYDMFCAKWNPHHQVNHKT